MELLNIHRLDDCTFTNESLREIYQKATNFYFEKALSNNSLELLINNLIAKNTLSETDLIKANRFLKIPVESTNLFCLGFCLFVLELPPLWDIRFDLKQQKVFFTYAVFLLGCTQRVAFAPIYFLY